MNYAVRLIPLLCAALLLASARPAAADNSPAPIVAVGGLGGWIEDAYVDGTLAYLLEGANLTILDISDPAALQVRSRTPLPMRADRLAAADGAVYLLCSEGLDLCDAPATLWVYDAHDPAAPAFAGSQTFDTPFWPSDARSAGGVLWVLGTGGLCFFDLQSPASPAPLAAIAGDFSDYLAAGPWLYLTSRLDGLQIWDLSSPRAPVLRVRAAPVSTSEMIYTGVALSGDRLYVTATPRYSSAPPSVIMTLDVRDPRAPVLLANATAPAGPVSVAAGRLVTLVEQRLLVYDMSDPAHPAVEADQPLSARGFQVAGDRLYAQARGIWEIIDLSSPREPAALGAYRISPPMQEIGNIKLVGTRLYTVGRYGFQIVDVSDPLRPVPQGQVRLDLSSLSFVADSTRAILLSNTGLHLIDASDPLSPTVRAVLSPDQLGGYPTGPMVLTGDRVYLATAVSSLIVRLVTLDISSLASPRVLSASYVYAKPGSTVLYVVGEQVYVASSYLENCGRGCWRSPCVVMVFDMSDPEQPRAGKEPFSSEECGISQLALYGTTLFAVGSQVWTIDVSDRDAFKLTDAQYPESLSFFKIIGHRAYLMDRSSLIILDLSDPLHPVALSRYVLGAGPNRMFQIAGDRAYVESDGLRLIDLRNPAGPLPLALYSVDLWSGLSTRVRVFMVDGDGVYLAMGENGLRILQIRPEYFPRPVLLPVVRKAA